MSASAAALGRLAGPLVPSACEDAYTPSNASVNWSASDTWNSLGGVQADGVKAVATPDASTPFMPLGGFSINCEDLATLNG